MWEQRHKVSLKLGKEKWLKKHSVTGKLEKVNTWPRTWPLHKLRVNKKYYGDKKWIEKEEGVKVKKTKKQVGVYAHDKRPLLPTSCLAASGGGGEGEEGEKGEQRWGGKNRGSHETVGALWALISCWWRSSGPREVREWKERGVGVCFWAPLSDWGMCRTRNNSSKKKCIWGVDDANTAETKP